MKPALKPTKEIAKALKISRQRLHQLLHQGRIEGAFYDHEWHCWRIPENYKVVAGNKMKRKDFLENWTLKAKPIHQRRAIALWIYKTKGVEMQPKSMKLTLWDQAKKWILQNGVSVADWEKWRKR